MWSSAWENHSVDVTRLDVNMNPESNTPNPDSNTPNPDSNTPNPNSNTPNPESNTPNPQSDTLFPDYLRSTPSAGLIYGNRNSDPSPLGAFNVERNLSTNVDMHTDFPKAAASVCTIQYFNISKSLSFHPHRFRMFSQYGRMEIIATQHWIRTLSFTQCRFCSLLL